MKKQKEPTVFNEKDLRDDLLQSAKAIGLSITVAEIITTKVAAKVAARLAKRSVVTAEDLNRFIAMEAEKYSQDLAYVYKNRDKII